MWYMGMGTNVEVGVSWDTMIEITVHVVKGHNIVVYMHSLPKMNLTESKTNSQHQ